MALPGITASFGAQKGFTGAPKVTAPKSQQYVASPVVAGLVGALAGGKVKAPKPPAAPKPTAGAAGAPAAPQGPSGLDATYFANTNTNQFKVGNQINALNLKSAADTTALQSALAQLAYQQPRAQLALEQKANDTGSLYSSVYDQNLGNLNYGYLGKEGGLINNDANAQAAINAQIAALMGSIPLYDAGQAAAAASRSSNVAAKNPAVGQPTPAKQLATKIAKAPRTLKAPKLKPGQAAFGPQKGYV